MHRDEALKKSDEALKELADALKQGKSDKLLCYLEMLSRFHRYSFGNTLLIALQRPDATFVAGFHRWRELGRYVKKGEAGIVILAPLLFRKKADEEAGGEVDKEANEAKSLRGFRVVHVFDVSQTEGKELAQFETVEGDPGERIEKVCQLIRRKGIELQFVESLGGALGKSEGGRVSVLSTLSPAETFTTLVHELSHELLHRGDRRAETTKTIRETEAEAVAFVVSKAVGLQCSTKSSDYIQLWSGDESLLLQSLELIRDVASSIIKELDAEVEYDLLQVA